MPGRGEAILVFAVFKIKKKRHFLSVRSILAVLDAMSYAKFNVLHWHLTDAESFPIVLPSIPKLSLGAYNSASVYHASDVQKIVQVHSVSLSLEIRFF